MQPVIRQRRNPQLATVQPLRPTLLGQLSQTMAVGVRVVVAQVVVPNEGTVDNAVIARKIRSLETCVTQGAARIVVTVHPVGPATGKTLRQY